MSEDKKVLIKARKLKKYFDVSRGKRLRAVDDVTFKIYEGEKFGVVGESGCGKSTLGRLILQLETQTSGSCVYFGKSIQEINPKYIQKEIDHLKKYQTTASDYYKKSLTHDAKVEALEAQAATLDPDGSSRDAKEYDKLKLKIDKESFASKELKKDASRQLREGSRTVGSLILCENIDEIARLFTQAEQEIQKAHECLVKWHEINNQIETDEMILNRKKTVPPQIEELEKIEEMTEEESDRLIDLKNQWDSVKKADENALQKEIDSLIPQRDEWKKQADEHHKKEMEYRDEAFAFRGKNILPITERAENPEYQKKLDENYETGINLSKLTKAEMRSMRKDMQMIFQDPSASLDPRVSIGKAIEEAFAINTDMNAHLRMEKTMELLKSVGLKPEHYYSYPNALSGGQKQRVGIARAIALNPDFVVLDEAVSALDVSVQAQILQLLNQLSEEKHLTYFFITHDLGVVKHFCDRVMVMYLGGMCELATCEDLFKDTLHPYTKSLLASVPRLTLHKDRENEEVLEGEVPSAINPPSGCPFHTRCSQCMEICKTKKPKLREIKDNHFVACHLYDEEN